MNIYTPAAAEHAAAIIDYLRPLVGQPIDMIAFHRDLAALITDYDTATS